ncbi:unnamed protein product [Callosobruchus maculatus]|uniref:Uncharacterized protein n=1 Tax=Callosobruchus maculatus TaxID=64391 RepID=A0A653DGF7_CALMS|nr:unnamed protein product [Callosobruchus maculatus]
MGEAGVIGICFKVKWIYLIELLLPQIKVKPFMLFARLHFIPPSPRHKKMNALKVFACLLRALYSGGSPTQDL